MTTMAPTAQPGGPPRATTPVAGISWRARAHERGRRVLVTIEVPEVPADQIVVEVAGTVLGVRCARGTSRLRYEADLPWPADTERVSAGIAQGVLTITVPRGPAAGAAAQPRRVPVTVT